MIDHRHNRVNPKQKVIFSYSFSKKDRIDLKKSNETAIELSVSRCIKILLLLLLLLLLLK